MDEDIEGIEGNNPQTPGTAEPEAEAPEARLKAPLKLHEASRDLPMGVDNLSFLVDRLGADCGPMQFLRELTQNAMEAIARNPHKSGDIIWDVDPLYETNEGVEKLCIIDTGVGMTGPEMLEYLNKLSSTSGRQSYAENYGVGAKVAALTHSPAGLVYLSWKDGKGAMVHLRRSPVSGEYGLRQFKLPDGSYSHWGSPSDALKPREIKRHGTKVILLGADERADTFNTPPEGVGAPSYWVGQYLGTRYFRVAEGVTMKTRNQFLRAAVGRREFEAVSGQKAQLDARSEARGKVGLTDAEAHWWILGVKGGGKTDTDPRHGVSSGQCAALFQNELYNLVTLNRGGPQRLQSFGIVVGYRRVVIFVEPTLLEVVPNTARSHLMHNNGPLPWQRWATEFREQLPQELVTYIDDLLSRSSGDESTKDVKKRLDEFRDLYKPSRYRPNPLGSQRTGGFRNGGESALDYPEDPELDILPEEEADSNEPPAPQPGSVAGAAGKLYDSFLREDGRTSTRVRHKAQGYPEIKEVSRELGNLDEDMYDRMARYDKDTDILLFNRDFRIFTDTVNFIEARNPAVATASPKLIYNLVKRSFRDALSEAVVSVEGLQGSVMWSQQEIEVALSNVALSVAVLPRLHLVKVVEDQIRERIRQGHGQGHAPGAEDLTQEA